MHRILAALIVCSLPGAVPAQSILEQLRDYDLNDYAFGIAVSASQNPFRGSDDSLFAYPYLTSFRHPAFTDGAFLIADGNAGYRWVTDSGLDLGVVGRVQTLGFGDVIADELRGMRDRDWTIEVAPMIAWRAWPVQITLRHYLEVLDKHDGGSTELSISYPREYDWGYFVPTIEGIHRSSEYSNYYFSVSDGESLQNRPTYSLGGTTSHAVRLNFGYALSNRWLLTGGAEVEFLADEITESPIVAEDQRLSVHIGLAYNSDLFQPRNSNLITKQQARFEFRAAAFADSVDSSVRRNRDSGLAGTDIDLEDNLGLSDSETVLQFDMTYRINAHHRIEAAYFELDRRGNAVIGEPVIFGEASYLTGTTIESHMQSEIARLSYGYSLINDAQKELGVSAGFHVTRAVIQLTEPVSVAQASSNVSSPLPVIGAFGSVEVGQHSSIAAQVQVFGTEFDRYDGALLNANVEWRRRFGESFSAGLAYSFYNLTLESADSASLGEIKVRHQGPAAFVVVRF